MKKKSIVRYLHGKGGVIEVDGITYRAGKAKTYMKDRVKHYEYTEYEPFDMNEHEKTLIEVGKRLKKTIPPERVIEELLKNYDTKDLKKLLKKLDTGEVRVKRHDGCLGLTIINKKKKRSQYLQIIQ